LGGFDVEKSAPALHFSPNSLPQRTGSFRAANREFRCENRELIRELEESQFFDENLRPFVGFPKRNEAGLY